MFRFFSFYIILIVLVGGFSFFTQPVSFAYAHQVHPITDESLDNLIDSGKAAGVDPNAEKDRSLTRYIARIVQQIIIFVGVIFMVLVVVGGMMWMMAGGSEEQVAKGQRLLRNALIGMMITFLAFLLSRLILTILIKSADTSFVGV